MRYDTQTSFGHPVLTEDGDDYLHATVQSNIELIIDKKTEVADLSFEMSLSVPEIAKKIRLGDAGVVVTASCSRTAVAHSSVFNQLSGSFRVDIKDFSDLVEFSCAVIALRDDVEISSEKINPEFGLERFVVNKGDVLALAKPSYRSFTKDNQRPISSLIKLGQNDSLRKDEWKTIFHDDYVEVQAGSELLDVLKVASGNKKGKVVLFNSILMPVMMEMLQAYLDDPGEIVSKKWGRVLEDRLTLFKDVDPQNFSPISVAQKMWEFPAGRLHELTEE